jgi:hypothetical protein
VHSAHIQHESCYFEWGDPPDARRGVLPVIHRGIAPHVWSMLRHHRRHVTCQVADRICRASVSVAFRPRNKRFREMTVLRPWATCTPVSRLSMPLAIVSGPGSAAGRGSGIRSWTSRGNSQLFSRFTFHQLFSLQLPRMQVAPVHFMCAKPGRLTKNDGTPLRKPRSRRTTPWDALPPLFHRPCASRERRPHLWGRRDDASPRLKYSAREDAPLVDFGGSPL